MRHDAAEQNLSKYRLGPLLGAGGMGEVYLAHDTSLNRDVAIKFIAADRLGDPDARRRLIREAQAAAALDHPSICAVHEVVDSVTRPFIVMQHVEGETLARRLERGPLPPDEAVALASHVADALQEAHRRGVVHRDLKPQNIILTPSGRPKIVDFGIARVRPATVGAGADDTRTALTNPNVIIGTPAYMAPEQIQLGPADARADLFSLGSVFYECLTGHRAFDGRSPLEICGQVLHHEPEAPSRAQPVLTAAHDEVCRRLLAKDPAARFQTAAEVVGALRTLEGESRPVAERRRLREHVGPLARSRRAQAALAITLLLAAAGVWGWTRGDGLPPLTSEAAQSFERGTDFIRDGAYDSARRALEHVLQLAPDYTPAQARLAEALAGLDEEDQAKGVLLAIEGRRVGGDERLRLAGVRAIVLHDAPRAVDAYSRLAQRRERDARAWVDLGRAQEAAGQPAAARESYQRALALESGYAAAHLRLASLDAEEGRRDEALEGFARAENLYRTASDSEGETESLIRRGAFLDGIGELKPARAALERAKERAAATDNEYQQIRVDIRLSSVTASEGNLRESEKLARAAAETALHRELMPLAADGYIELGATLMNDPKHLTEAEETLQRAVALAERRGAVGVAARARLNLSSVYLSRGQPDRALALAQGALPDLQQRRLRRLELSALGLVAEAYDRQGNYASARDAARNVLTSAEQIRDTSSIVQALLTLGRASAALGSLPEALASSTRVEEVLRTQGDDALLPFAMTTRAELLVRLGRGRDAEPLLQQLEAGIAAKRETFVGRARRVALVRALQAATEGRHADVRQHAARALATTSPRDAADDLAAALLAYSQSRLERRVTDPRPFPTTGTPAALERVYWRALAMLPASPAAALEAVHQVLEGKTLVSPEAEWRLAAVGAAAALRSGDSGRAEVWRKRAELTLQRLRTSWREHAPSYEARPDLQELRRAAGLGAPPA